MLVVCDGWELGIGWLFHRTPENKLFLFIAINLFFISHKVASRSAQSPETTLKHQNNIIPMDLRMRGTQLSPYFTD